MRAVQIAEFGGPEVLRLVDLPVPEAGEGEELVEVSRSGINFADTHTRENSYVAKFELPLVPGGEVAGTSDGRRVVAMLMGQGGYAEYAAAPAATTFDVPDGLSDEAALALLIQGLTAWHLYRTSARVQPDESVVVHAAAGGVGSLAVQLGKPMGAGRVIATASSEEKRQKALELGADAAVDTGADDLHAALLEANDGRKVDVVFEMAGGPVFDASLRALAPFGRLVTYGIAGREQNELQSGYLMARSKAVVGFYLGHCLGRRELMEEPLADLFGRTARGELVPQVGTVYPLSEASRAHEDMAARRTTGKLTLDPSA